MTPRSALWQSRKKCDTRAGTTTLEFALVMPAFLMIIFGIEEFSRCVWTQSALQFAVEAAARCAAVDAATCGNTSQVQQYAASKMPAPGARAAAFTYNNAATCGSLVSGTLAFTFVVNLVQDGSVTLTAQSCYPA